MEELPKKSVINPRPIDTGDRQARVQPPILVSQYHWLHTCHDDSLEFQMSK